jgi:hypothetical protein
MEANRAQLKSYFETGDRPSQSNFEDLIDSQVHITENKATDAEAQAGTVDNKYVTPKTAKAAIEALSPVKTINGQAPVNGNIALSLSPTDIPAIPVTKVTGLDTSLNSKLNTTDLASSLTTNLKTINGASIVGTGDLYVPKRVILIPNSDITLVDSSNPIIVFSSSGINLAINKTYLFRGVYIISNNNATQVSRFISITWATPIGGIASMEYVARIFSSAANTAVATVSQVQISGTGIKALHAANTSPTSTIQFEGVIRTTTTSPSSSTLPLLPQLKFSAAPGGVSLMKKGSFIEFTEIGSNTIDAVTL